MTAIPDDVVPEDDELVIALTPAQLGAVIALLAAIVIIVRALRRSDA